MRQRTADELQGFAWGEQSERQCGVHQPSSIAALDCGSFVCVDKLAYEALPFSAVMLAQGHMQHHLGTEAKWLSNRCSPVAVLDAAAISHLSTAMDP